MVRSKKLVTMIKEWYKGVGSKTSLFTLHFLTHIVYDMIFKNKWFLGICLQKILGPPRK